MGLKWFTALSILAGFIPFLAVVAIVAHFLLQQIRQKARRNPSRRSSRLCTVGLALGLAFVELMRSFYQPDMVYVLAATREEAADEDGSGDPESPQGKLRHFHRQLRRIRRGEPVDRLQWKT
jgi:hypothetical protein